MRGRTTTALVLFASAALVAVAPATAQRLNFIHLTPEREQEVIRMLTTGASEEWNKGQALASRVPPDGRGGGNWRKKK